MKLNKLTITSIATVPMIILSASVYAQSDDFFNDAEIADIAVTAKKNDLNMPKLPLKEAETMRYGILPKP